MKKQPRYAIGILYALVLVLVFAAVSRLAKFPQSETVPYSQVVKLFEDEQVKSFVIKDDVITLQLHRPYHDQTQVRAELVDLTVFYNDLNELVRDQSERGIIESYSYPPNTRPSVLAQMLPYLPRPPPISMKPSTRTPAPPPKFWKTPKSASLPCARTVPATPWSTSAPCC